MISCGLTDPSEYDLLPGKRPIGKRNGTKTINEEQEQSDRKEAVERDLADDIG